MFPRAGEPRDDNAAHRQPARQERPPPSRNRVQSLRALAADGGGIRRAHGRQNAFYQGDAYRIMPAVLCFRLPLSDAKAA